MKNNLKQSQIDKIQVVSYENNFPKVKLVNPSNSGYLLIALEIDKRPPIGFFIESRKKKEAIKIAKVFSSKSLKHHFIKESNVFKALIIPPGRGNFLKQRPNALIAKFDLVLLIEFENYEKCKQFSSTLEWADFEKKILSFSKSSITLTGKNIRSIGNVDHTKNGVFLFNYFFADDLKQNLGIWEFTAGWFQYQTNLDNSNLILPDMSKSFPYKIINHCRWDNLFKILPSLLFKKSFKNFVLKNFELNNVAAMPILYRLA